MNYKSRPIRECLRYVSGKFEHVSEGERVRGIARGRRSTEKNCVVQTYNHDALSPKYAAE